MPEPITNRLLYIAMKISLEHLYQKAATQPPGFIEDFIAAGEVKDCYVRHIPPPVFEALRRKYYPDYDPSTPPKKKITGLGDLVAMIAKPIARAIDSVAGTDLKNCKTCDKNQAKLNAAIPFATRQN